MDRRDFIKKATIAVAGVAVEKFMIYRRDAKKGEATYSPKSHSAPHFVGHYVEGMEEWASWYCFNKKEQLTT